MKKYQFIFETPAENKSDATVILQTKLDEEGISGTFIINYKDDYLILPAGMESELNHLFKPSRFTVTENGNDAIQEGITVRCSDPFTRTAIEFIEEHGYELWNFTMREGKMVAFFVLKRKEES